MSNNYPPEGQPPQGQPPQGYPQGQPPQGNYPPPGYYPPPEPPKKKKKKWPWVVGIIVVLVLLAGIGGMGSNSSTTTDSGTATSTTTPASTETKQEDKKEEPAQPDYYTIGQTVEVDGVSFTLKSAEVTNAITSSTGYDMEAEAGKEFLVLDWDINNGSKSTYYLSSGSFETYCDNQSINEDAVTYSEPNALQFSELGAGRQTGGTVVYAVPQGWQTFEAKVDVSMWSNQDANFKITSSEIN